MWAFEIPELYEESLSERSLSDAHQYVASYSLVSFLCWLQRAITYGKDENVISEVCGTAATSNLIPCSGVRWVSAGFLPKHLVTVRFKPQCFPASLYFQVVLRCSDYCSVLVFA